MNEDWSEYKLTDVCRLINGRAYSRNELLSEGKYRVLRVGNFFTNNSWYYSDLELEDDKYCEKGDLLYAWSASFGPRIWNAEKVIYHYHIWKVDFDRNKIDKRFLFYWFELDKEKVKAEQGAGTTMIHVSMTSMNQRVIPLPPLDEQQRIVAILDEAFAGIDKAIANTERNLANAKELFESYLNSVFANPGAERKLGEVAENLDSQRIPITEKDRISGDIPYYGASGVVDNVKDYIFNEDLLLVSEDGKNLEYRTKPIAFSISGKSWVNNHAHVLRFENRNYEYLVKSYLNWLPLAPYLTGVDQVKLTKGALSSIPVPWYNGAHELDNIANGIRQFEQVRSDLSKNFQAKLRNLRELKQSILQKAFTGELTAKDGAALAASAERSRSEVGA